MPRGTSPRRGEGSAGAGAARFGDALFCSALRALDGRVRSGHEGRGLFVAAPERLRRTGAGEAFAFWFVGADFEVDLGASFDTGAKARPPQDEEEGSASQEGEEGSPPQDEEEGSAPEDLEGDGLRPPSPV